MQVVLPADLRSLECPLCPFSSSSGRRATILLAQDRLALLRGHAKREHGHGGGAGLMKEEITYKCR